MRGIFGFNVVEFMRKRKQSHWISKGFKSENIQLNNGTSLHCWVLKNSYSVLGNQRPTLLLIHGFGADGLVGWDTQICELGKHFDLLIPDLIFFGNSTTTSSERTELFQAECMKSMVEYLAVESVIVVGHSYGGFVGFWMAHKYPNLVRRLVIVSSAICMTPSTNDSLLKELGSDDIKDVLIPKNCGDMRKGMNITFYKMPWLPTCIYQDLLQDVLIVWGEKDRTFRLDQAFLLQRHIGEKGKVVVIKECGHVPQLEKPTEFNETLLNFLLLNGELNAQKMHTMKINCADN